MKYFIALALLALLFLQTQAQDVTCTKGDNSKCTE